MRKKIALILVLFTAVIFIASCDAEKEEFTPEYLTGIPDGYGTEGLTLTFLSDWATSDPFNMEIDTLYGDMMKDRVKNVEDTYSCKVQYSTSSSSMVTHVMSLAAAGVKAGDLYYGRSTCTLAFGGYLYPLTEVADIVDYRNENKYGTANLLEFSMADGIPYGVVPVMWPSKITSANMGPIVVIGVDLIKQYGLDDPRDFYEQGVWTLNKLDEITPLYHIKDGETEIKTLNGSLANFSCGIFGAVGMTMVVEKNDGTLTAGYNTPEMLEVLTWARDYCQRNADAIVINGDASSYNKIASGEAMMAVMASYIISISKTLDNFGIIPFPHDERFITAGNQRSYYDFFDSLAILDATDSPEASAVLMSALCEPFKEYYSTLDELAEFLSRTLFFDERDGFAFLNILKQAVSDYNQCGGYNAFSSSGLGQAFLNMTATEAVAAYETAQDTIIEKYIAGNYEYMKDYWK